MRRGDQGMNDEDRERGRAQANLCDRAHHGHQGREPGRKLGVKDAGMNREADDGDQDEQGISQAGKSVEEPRGHDRTQGEVSERHHAMGERSIRHPSRGERHRHADHGDRKRTDAREAQDAVERLGEDQGLEKP